MRSIVAIFTVSACAFFVLCGNDASAEGWDHQRHPQLQKLLKDHQWERAKNYTSNVIQRKGDVDNDGIVKYDENDRFPCDDLRAMMNLWKVYFRSSGGLDDILIPRFHNRAVSCEIWER